MAFAFANHGAYGSGSSKSSCYLSCPWLTVSMEWKPENWVPTKEAHDKLNALFLEQMDLMKKKAEGGV